MSYIKIVKLLVIFIFSLFYSGGNSIEACDKAFSAIVGSRMIDKTYYNELILQPEFSKNKFRMGLNLLARWNEEGFRDEDWDEIGNIVNYVSWAQKGDKPLHIHLGRLSSVTLGQGFVVDRYSNQGTDTSKGVLGCILDINLRYGGIETLVNDVTDPRVWGGRIYFIPFKNIDIPLVNKIIIGVTYVNDTEPQPGDNEDLTIYGIDCRLPIYEKILSFYVDYAKIENFGAGIASGLGGKLQLPQVNTTWEYKMEFRHRDANFIPSFFNALYETTKKGTQDLQKIERSQRGWYVGANLNIAESILATARYENLEKDKAPMLHLALKLEERLLRFITRQNISVDISYDHERKEEKYHLLDFNAPNSTITCKINYKILENLSLSYTHQEIYDGERRKSETSSLSTQIHF